MHRDNVLHGSLNSIFWTLTVRQLTLTTKNKVEKENRNACISRIKCKINLQGPQIFENDQWFFFSTNWIWILKFLISSATSYEFPGHLWCFSTVSDRKTKNFLRRFCAGFSRSVKIRRKMHDLSFGTALPYNKWSSSANHKQNSINV